MDALIAPPRPDDLELFYKCSENLAIQLDESGSPGIEPDSRKRYHSPEKGVAGDKRMRSSDREIPGTRMKMGFS